MGEFILMLASCKSGGCLAALICQTRLHKALFRTDPGVMPWHSWSCILGLCRSIPGVTSVHGQYNTETVSRYCCHKELPLPLCVSSFLLSLTSDFNIFKSSQSSLVLISSHFLFPFHRMRRSHWSPDEPQAFYNTFLCPCAEQCGRIETPSVLPTGLFLVVKIAEQFYLPWILVVHWYLSLFGQVNIT